MRLRHNPRDHEEASMIRIRLGAILLCALAIGQARVASSAPKSEPKWNQQEVLGLAEQLVRALDEIAAAAREAPPQATVLQQRTRDDALNSIGPVREAANDYVAKLRKGWDRDLTETYFRNLKKQFIDTRKLARDAVPTEEVERKLREADGIFEELSRFYPNA
jgi:hypothetical protein